MNSVVAKETTMLKLKGCLVADVHKGKRKVYCFRTHTIGTCSMRRTNQDKPESVKREMEYLNITVLGVSKLKQTGIEHFSQTSTECLTLEMTTSKEMWL